MIIGLLLLVLTLVLVASIFLTMWVKNLWSYWSTKKLIWFTCNNMQVWTRLLIPYAATSVDTLSAIRICSTRSTLFWWSLPRCFRLIMFSWCLWSCISLWLPCRVSSPLASDSCGLHCSVFAKVQPCHRACFSRRCSLCWLYSRSIILSQRWLRLVMLILEVRFM